MNKKPYYFVLLVFFLAGASVFAVKIKAQWIENTITPLVLGDEDEDDEGGAPVNASSASTSSSSKPATKTVTTYVKLPDQIIKRVIETTIYDSDGDGVFDPDDSTPNLHNIFLVKDDNRNGIADEYEKGE